MNAPNDADRQVPVGDSNANHEPSPNDGGESPTPNNDDDDRNMEEAANPPSANASEDDDDDDATNKEPEQPPTNTVVLQQYSTRGRSTDAAADGHDHHSRPSIDALLSSSPLLVAPPPRASNSFLSDSITEEERRTRTRYIPAVDGMQALRKHQVKADLMLAAVGSSSLAASSRSSKKILATSNDGEDDAAMLMDDDAVVPANVDFDDDRGSQQQQVVQVNPQVSLVLPSPAFVAPPTVSLATTSAAAPTNPHKIDSITAFQPPRPPESIGAKQQHRLQRWERQPSAMAVDLESYQKTVDRTRVELGRTLQQVSAVHQTEAHVRRHYLQHLHCQQQEWVQLQGELAIVEDDLVQATGWTPTRSTTRNTSQITSEQWMPDVLASLHEKGRAIQANGLSATSSVASEDHDRVVHGVGGVAAVNLVDWDRSTFLPATKLASAWMVPGDLVETPYGQGRVVAVLGLERVDDAKAGSADPKEANEMDAMDVEKQDDNTPASPEKEGSSITKELAQVSFVMPRISVRLPFGVGFFPVDSVVSQEGPVGLFSDARLAKRWKGLVETGRIMGDVVDSTSMPLAVENEENRKNGDDAATDKLATSYNQSMLPFGAGLLPTVAGRGALLSKMTVDELDQEISTVMLKGAGALGGRDNPGVTKEIRAREDIRQKKVVLEATVLQLKNQLYRQRRVRLMNERMYAATQERAGRMEALVSEMRTDLKTLKRRLDEDVADLGIDQEQAEALLKAYYDSLDYKHSGESSPPKRVKRESLMAESGLTDEDDDDLQNEINGSIEILAATAQ